MKRADFIIFVDLFVVVLLGWSISIGPSPVWAKALNETEDLSEPGLPVSCTVILNVQNGDNIQPVLNAATSKAQVGDVICVPAGNFTFTGKVPSSGKGITDGIYIKGAGMDQTKIIKQGSATGFSNAMIQVDCQTGQPFRFSDMTLEGTGTALVEGDLGLYLKGKCQNFEIFNSRFTGFGRAGLTFRGNVGSTNGQPQGVVYDNRFEDNYLRGLGYGIEVIGNDSEAWSTYPRFAPNLLGGADNVFIEDNYFEANRHTVASNNGSRYVFRCNQINDNREDAAAIDAHGKASWDRGSRSYEIYENTLDNSPAIIAGVGIRGGDGVIWNNTMVKGYQEHILLWNDGGASSYPRQDQIRELYIWGNTYQGGPANVEVCTRSWCGGGSVTNIIQENREYYLGTPEQAATDGATNAQWGIASYTSYPYPHVLASNSSGTCLGGDLQATNPLEGDIDQDGDVDIFDYNILIENFGNTNCGNVADINGDCKVDIFDYNLLVTNFGKSSATPTPTAKPTPTPTPSPTNTPTPTPTTAAPKEVTSNIFSFTLEDLTVPVGTTVTWVNQDGVQHTTTSGTPDNPTGVWDSPLLSKGDTFSHTFTKAGVYPYFCRPHSSFMKATVTVVE
ncbi:hypothetical protein IID21_03795 [Patescibacteria group bacterium]|nr:hypothetical protein [Patescibacteria group bacterium]